MMIFNIRKKLGINPKAALYMLISSVGFAAMYILAKQLEGYGGYMLVFFRGLGTFLLAISYLIFKKVSLVGNAPKWLLARGLTGAASLTLFFLAIPYVPITAAVAIRYLSPLFAIMFAMLWLGERVKPIQWLYFAIAFAGVVLLKGVDARIGGLGLVLILSSALLGGVTFAIIRKIGTSEHPLVIVSYFTGFATLIGLSALLLEIEPWQMPQGNDWLWLIGLGIVGFIGQIFMTIAMQTEVASKVMPLKYFEAIFLLIFSFSLLGETYGPVALLGMALILAGNIANGFSKK